MCRNITHICRRVDMGYTPRQYPHGIPIFRVPRNTIPLAGSFSPQMLMNTADDGVPAGYRSAEQPLYSQILFSPNAVATAPSLPLWMDGVRNGGLKYRGCLLPAHLSGLFAPSFTKHSISLYSALLPRHSTGGIRAVFSLLQKELSRRT